MNKNLSRYFVFGVFLIAVLGCSLFNKIQKEITEKQKPQIMTAADGSCQITVPGDWKTLPELNAEATIQAGNLIRERYIIVIRESKKDFGKKADLDFFTDVVRDNFKQTAAEPVLSESVPVNINGYAARQFEAGGEIENIKAKYLYTTVETPDNFYQIMTWTLSSRYAENKGIFSEVISSFKETDRQTSGSQNSNIINK